MIVPSVARRAEQETPETAEAAALRFRCLAYQCEMSGRSCALDHVKARETQRLNREACIACPAGAARADFLGVSKVLPCMARPSGRDCGQPAATGKLFCEPHKHQRAGIDMGRMTAAKPMPRNCPICGNRATPAHTKRVCERAVARLASGGLTGKRGVPSGVDWGSRETRALMVVLTLPEVAAELHVSESTVRVARRRREITGPDGRALRKAPCFPCWGWTIVEGDDGPELRACTICGRVPTATVLQDLPTARRALAQARAARGLR